MIHVIIVVRLDDVHRRPLRLHHLEQGLQEVAGLNYSSHHQKELFYLHLKEADRLQSPRLLLADNQRDLR